MNVSITDLKMNAGKYISMAEEQDIFVTRNGKRVAKISSTKQDRQSAMDSLLGILPEDFDEDAARMERLTK